MSKQNQQDPVSAGEFHGRIAEDWERKYEERPSFRARERILSDLLKARCRPGSVWLDAGCGTGRFSRRLAELGAGRVLGLDAAPQMLDVAKRLADAKGLSGIVSFSGCNELSRIPGKDQSFDGILCSSVLEYLDNPDEVLREFARLLKPGGALVVTLPNRSAWLRVAQNACFTLTRRLLGKPWPPYLMLVKHQYRRAGACRLIREAGFQVDGIQFGGSGFDALRLDRFAFWGPLMFSESRLRAPDARPSLLVLVRTFYPGFKAGGPIQSLHALVRRLSDAFGFKVLAGNRDAGDVRPFEGIRTDAWMPVAGAEVMYLSPRAATARNLIRLINRTDHDLLYINSFFDPIFTLAPLVARQLGALKRRPILLAPRGELSEGALAQKWFKKKVFLKVTQAIGLYRNVRWHASCEEERLEILQAFRGDLEIAGRISIARNLAITPPAAPPGAGRLPKQAGVLRAVFVSRISPKKNLARAVEMLGRVKGRVSFDVFGNISDPAYWRQCLEEAARHPDMPVVYRGAIPHETVVQRLREYDVFVFPTLGENFGHVILESLLAGCPVCVSSATPWQSLEAEGAGWVIPLDREEDFVRALQNVADMDESAHARIREQAERMGREALNDPRPVEDNLRLFRETLEKDEHGGAHAG